MVQMVMWVMGRDGEQQMKLPLPATHLLWEAWLPKGHRPIQVRYPRVKRIGALEWDTLQGWRTHLPEPSPGQPRLPTSPVQSSGAGEDRSQRATLCCPALHSGGVHGSHSAPGLPRH